MNAPQAIVPHGHDYRNSTDAAGLCGAIVKQTASDIQGRRYVSVEGWQAIAIAHGCAAGARDVEKVEGGVRAIGEIRRMTDGQLIATAEGFVGEDEPTWYGGKNKWGKEQPKRPDYAIRAMAQTRAISRACRSAFAHVVVMIDAGLSTTPAEEVPDGGFVEGQFQDRTVSPREPADYTPLEPVVEQPVKHDARKDPWSKFYSGRSALHKGLTVHAAELTRLGDEGTFDDLEAYQTSPEYVDFIAVASKHMPHYLEGGPPAPEEFQGIFALETRAKDMIAIRGNQPAEMEKT
jgi:hypothetical protein